MKQEPKVINILANGERVSSIEGKVIPSNNAVYEQVLKGAKKKMKKITIGLVLLLIGMATVDSASQVAPLALMAVGMVLMWRGGKNEKLF